MNPQFKKYLLELTEASDCFEVALIQSLWSGYGKIVRYQLKDAQFESVVIKMISPDNNLEHPRGWNTDLSHQRKVKSYEVETFWYKNWRQLCKNTFPIPQFFGSFSKGNSQWIVMEDLKLNFPVVKKTATIAEVKICLKWLANFHATFMDHQPTGLWNTGTYWHLETRPDEFKKIVHQGLKEKAHLIDARLNQCQFQTIVHGDAKLANFCFSENGKKVAAVDFQYVGGGCGIKDVAYLIGSCLSSDACELYENELLLFYFAELEKALNSIEGDINLQAVEQEWRAMYPFAVADFTRFMLGWMPTHQKINAHSLKILNQVLATL